VKSQVGDTTQLNSESLRPLCVDMDGTLLATDALWESIVLVAKKQPTLLLWLPFWLYRGKAFLKRQLALHVTLNPALLPHNEAVVSFVTAARRAGRHVVLATAADRRVADTVAQRLDVFSAVLASDGQRNLSGREKLAAIVDHLKGADFDYIGNSSTDLPIWKAAARSVLVRPSGSLLAKARRVSSVHEISWTRRTPLATVFRALRIHQWSKNALLFVPLLLAHRLTDSERVLQGVVAFVAFGLAASAVYLVNDLLDLETDRQHPQKRFRPIASGEMSIPMALAAAPVAIGASVAVTAATLPFSFVAVLLLYLVTTSAYSLGLKRIAIIDVLLLAGLYTLRVVAGAAATDIAVSPWFLAFSMFIFLSLALVKRYAELKIASDADPTGYHPHLSGRPYLIGDLDLLRSVGSTSGYLSVAVLALYLNSPEVHRQYDSPVLLWLIGPLLLYWLTRVWLLAHRGQLNIDPVLFALTDRASYVVATLVVAILALATL
jgi:4-hydroxybenzoate polyprenyltransferase/phosphoserine phosphatase